MKRCFVHAVVAILCSSCDPASETHHPNDFNAPEPSASAIELDSIPRGLSAHALTAWRRVRTALLTADSIWGIGYDDSQRLIFGRIGDAKLNARGLLAILDEQAQEVRIFDAEGRHLHRLGGIGDGPNQLRQAMTLEWFGHNRLVIPTLAGLKVFSLRDGHWRLQHTVKMPMQRTTSMCAIAGESVLLSTWDPQQNTVIAEFSELLDSVSRFGSGYQDEQWLVRRQMSEGAVGCVDALKNVAFAFRYSPQIRMYSAEDHTVHWSGFLVNHAPVGITEVVHPRYGTPGVRMYLSGEYDILNQVVGTPSGHVILQYTHGNSYDDTEDLRTYLVDGNTGIGAYVGDMLPRITSTSETQFVTVLDDPHPRVVVREVIRWR